MSRQTILIIDQLTKQKHLNFPQTAEKGIHGTCRINSLVIRNVWKGYNFHRFKHFIFKQLSLNCTGISLRTFCNLYFYNVKASVIRYLLPTGWHRFLEHLTKWVTDWQNRWLTNWLTDWVTEWRHDWLSQLYTKLRQLWNWHLKKIQWLTNKRTELLASN